MRHLCAVIAPLLAGPVFAETINVPEDYALIQDAIDASSDGDVIQISAGTYNEIEIDMSGKNITLSGEVDTKGLPITTIDGQSRIGSVLIFQSGESRETTIDSLRIVNGFNPQGASVYCLGSSPTLRNCFLEDGIGFDGGAVFCDSASPLLQDCVMRSNTALNTGGAISCINMSDVRITNCIIENNTASGHGGGLFSENSDVHMQNVEIRDNIAQDEGGGIWCRYGNSVSITDSTISNNNALQVGGVAVLASTLTLQHCQITGNTGTSFIGGVATVSTTGSTIENCIITQNEGGDSCGGLYVQDCQSMLVSECSIQGNTADYDASMRVTDSILDLPPTVTVMNTTICDGSSSPQVTGPWTNGGNVCLAVDCNDSDDDGIPDKCNLNTGDGILEVPTEYPTIQEAIQASGYGDTILVAPGTYTGSGESVIDPLGKPITIMASGSPEDTILDGENARRVVHVGSGESLDTVIQGFTITNGLSSYGAGIYCSYSNPSIVNCTITLNSGTSASDTRGGGIYLLASSPAITNCRITNHTLYSFYRKGAGIYCTPGSDPVISDCIISNNNVYLELTRKVGWGGGLYSDGNPTIVNCLFESNGADSGGGIYCGSSSTISVVGTEFTNNYGGSGGGAYLANNTRSAFEQCRFTSNNVTSQYEGGGGIRTSNGQTLAVTNCHFESNIARSGAGILSSAADLTIDNCYFKDNLLNEDFGTGSAVSCSQGLVNDSIFCGNYDPLGRDQITGAWTDAGWNLFWDQCDDCNGNGTEDMQDILDGASLDLDQDGVPDECEYDCDADGTPDPIELYFGDATDYDSDGHPDNCQEDCDDDGFPDTWAIEIGFVQDCNASGVPDTCEDDCNGNGLHDSCDIASNESGDVNADTVPDECQCLADINQSNEVNVEDLLLVISQWNLFGGTADIDQNGQVGVADLLYVISSWGTCP